MHIEEITNTQALAFVLAIVVVSILILRFGPGVQTPKPPRRRYTDAEITAHDAYLPKYFIAAAIALALGGLHAAIKSLPPAYVWLAYAGHGGHMVRDLANTHLVIVIGGTVAATGLTWYVLPRLTRRPLYSAKLATWSFWCTVIGAGGFAVTQVVLGLIFGKMAHDGIYYEDAKDMIGVWRALPLGLTSSIMGIGYWTFVANVFLTVWEARLAIGPRPQWHLVKFIVVGAIGLLIGTVQGVIQVMPAKEAWLHAAAPAGQYIDPIAHAHVNLITGSLSLIAGFVFFVSAKTVPLSPGRKRTEQLVFWTMVPGSVLFYLSFMTLGFVEGRLIVDQGLSYPRVLAQMGLFHSLPLAIAGTWMLVGVWILLGTMVKRFAFGPERHLVGAPLVVAAALVLFVGTTQGLMQVLPQVKLWIYSAGDAGDAVANAHAQLNMLGGVLPALLGIAFTEAPVVFGFAVSRKLSQRVLRLIIPGIVIYYLAAMGTAIVSGEAIRQGLVLEVALARIQFTGPWLMSVGAQLYGLGYAMYAVLLWRRTPAYRVAGWRSFLAALASYDGKEPAWRRRIPITYFLLAEAVGALAGFPGFGWIMSGRALVGLTMACVSPALAWAIVPLLMSPLGDGPLKPYGWHAALAYILITAGLSVSTLALRLTLQRQRSTALRTASHRERQGQQRPAPRAGGAAVSAVSTTAEVAR